jgi:hypothetical protein
MFVLAMLMASQAHAFGGSRPNPAPVPPPVGLPTARPIPRPIPQPPYLPPSTPTPVPGTHAFEPTFTSTIQNSASARCIDDLGWTTVAGSLFGIWDCDAMENQNFNFSINGQGYYSLQNANNDLCLEIEGSGSNAAMEKCSGAANQEFQLQQESSGVFQLVSQTGLCLDLVSGNTADGAHLQADVCASSSSRQFVIHAPSMQNVGLSVPPAGAHEVFNIENLSGWQTCTGACSACPANDPTCSGAVNANMITTVQQVALPVPLAGAATSDGGLFQVNAGPAYATSLWGHSIGSTANYTHFLWNFDFLVDTTEIQNQEFDYYADVGGKLYMVGSQCNHESGNWQGWNQLTQHWENTSVPCPAFAPYTWHHVILDVSINPASGTYTYNAIQIDGLTYAANLSNQPAAPSNWGAVTGVQIQIDQNQTGSEIREYIENMNVQMW